MRDLIKYKIKKKIEKYFPGLFFESKSTKLLKTRIWSGKYRVLPEVIIVGVQKAATTSLFYYLGQHPQVKPCIAKQPHYFDLNFNLGIEWYKAHFISSISKKFFQLRNKKKLISVEATTEYFTHPLVPSRVKNILPNAKIIIVLREPVERAFSHFQMLVKSGQEKRSFMDAINSEKEEEKNEMEKILNDEFYQSKFFLTYGYLYRGRYVEHIKKWLKYFEEKQILIIMQNDLLKNPQETMNNVFRFLKIDEDIEMNFEKLNVGKYKEMDVNIKKELEIYFQPHNKKLENEFNIKFENS